MRKRVIRKLWQNPDQMLPYGLHRSRGSRKLRRGRRSILRDSPNCRDWSHLPARERLRLLEKALERLKAR